MLHTEVFDKFKEISHIKDESIECWFPNGRNSVRVRLRSRIELVLTYWSQLNWKLETLNSFVDDIYKTRKMKTIKE